MGAAAAPPTFGRIAEGVTVPLATGDGSGLFPALARGVSMISVHILG